MFAKLNALVMFLAALALTAGAQQPNQSTKIWAVVIGVSKYQKLPGGQQLQFADRDAALFAEAIQKRGVGPQNVRLLIGPEATAAAIKSSIGNWLARSASENDTVLIFFSGHGLFEREFGEAYLLGYDADPKDPYGTAFSLADLTQALDHRVHSEHVLVITDAVRRDFFDPDSDPNSSQFYEQVFERLTASRPGVSAIIASGAGEFSREGQRWGGHGAFTKHLADALNEGVDRNGDGAITADELFDHLTARLAEDTSNKQHPWRSGTGLAQIALAHIQPPPPVVAKSAPPAITNVPNTVAQARASETTRPDAGRAIEQKKPASPVPSQKKPEPPLIVNKADVPAATVTKAQPAAAPTREMKAEAIPSNIGGKKTGADSTVTNKPAEKSRVAAPRPVEPAPEKATSTRPVPASGGEPVRATQPAPSREPVGPAVVTAAPPKPPGPPSAVAVSSERAGNQPETLSNSVPVVRPEAAPSPLVLQLEAAIASKNLLDPKNASAWDFYQRLAADPGAAADVARLRPALAEALSAQGRSIVGGDVRSDNISDKVDDFKRAGQMLVRARALAPDNGAMAALEKLSAAEALISLQFYDEAERALAQLQSATLASVENAFGLVYQGKLDAWRAERAFKRAIELDAKWAAPHYNLALLYRSQQNQTSLGQFEAAAALDQGNVDLATALGEEYFTRQQWKQAAEAFRKAIALKPSDDTLHTKLGHALYSQGLQDEANREYLKARDLRSKQP